MLKFLSRFIKGWTSDTEPSQQPEDTLRDMNNMRIMAENKNSASVQQLLGTLPSFDLNPNYFPIGFWKSENEVIVFSTKDITGTDQNGEIGIATINPITNVGTYTPMYNHQDLTFNATYQIEARAYDENESKRRVYWTDDYNTYRKLNLADPRLTTYFNQAAVQAAVGDQFMVLTGTVVNLTSTYGPNQAAGTVLVSDGTEVFAGSPLVIEYIDVSLLDAVPTKDQDLITFNKWLLNGSLLGGGYQFTYQLMTSDGVETNFSYLTKAFHVGDPTVPSASSVDYQAFQGSATNENSQKGIRITITGIDTNFTQIRVVAIRCIDDNATDAPVVIFEGDITGASMDFDYFGTENLGTVSIDDLAAPVLAIKKVNTHDILKGRMFIGGVQLADYVPVDTTGITMTPIEYRYQVDKTGLPDSATDATTAGLAAPGYQPETGLTVIDTDQWYEVLTTPVSYNGGPALNVGDTFQGVTTVHTYVGAGTVRAVTKIQRYTGTYKLLPVRDDWTDNKNAGVAAELKSHWRQEIYRYAVLVFDPFGNPQFGHWIDDWETPAIYDTLDPNTGAPLAFNPRLGEFYANDYGAGLHSLSARSIGINFSNIDFGAIATSLGTTVADLPKYMSGFSIVRAKRDAQIIGQGILMPSSLSGIDVRPQGPPVLGDDYYYNAAGLVRRSNGYFFYSPDLLFDPAKAGAVDGDLLEVVDYIEDTQKAFTGGTLETNNYHYYEKNYVSQAAPGGNPAKGTQNNLVVPNCLNNAPNANGNAIGTTGDVIKNESGVVAGGPYGANARDTVGTWSFFTYTETAEPAGGWSVYAASGDERSLVNFVRPKSNLYGGQSEAALAATLYSYCGHYQPMDAAFLAYLAGNGNIADDIEVFGGDTYVTLFDVARMIRCDNTSPPVAYAPFGAGDDISFGSFFLVESNFNVGLRQGRHLAKDRSVDETQPLINTNGISYSNPTQPEEWVYNTGYSYEESQLQYTGVPLNYLPNNQYKHRVYASDFKTDGELVDKFTVFGINNYRDLNGVNGDIINLRSKAGRLFYAQQDAVGYLPVNEREVIPNALGAPVTIGTGGVLERYDDIATYYGNQHQFGWGETEDAFVWFDAHRREVCVLNVGGSVLSLSLLKGLRNEFANIIGDVLTNDNPVRNAGIAAAYNQPLKELVLSFRGVGDPAARAVNPYWPIGFSIGFDNINKQFTGKFDLLPGIMFEFNNMLLMSYTARFPTIAGFGDYPLGYRLTDGTSVYVCILAFSAPFIAVAPSADPTHWTKIMDMNEIHLADKGDVCKFFGYVYDNSMAFIANPESNEDKVFDNLVVNGSEDFFDTLVGSNSYQSGTDTALTTNGEWEYRFTSWHGTLPFNTADEDRLRDKYLLVTLTKDNKLNGQYNQSKNERVKVISLLTSYRKLH